MIEAALLPEAWTLVPLRRVLRKAMRPVPEVSGIVTAYRDGTVTLRSVRRDEGYTLSDAEAGYQGVRKGDLVFHALDGFAGAVGVSDSTGRCTPVYHVCEGPLGDDLRFVAYALRAMGSSGFLALQAGNVRQRSVDFRPWEAFARIPFARPPIPRQAALADLLDHETARIDALIEKKRNMIALLRDRLQAQVDSLLAGFVAEPLKHAVAISVSNVDKLAVEGQQPVRLCNYTDVYYNDEITDAADFMTASATPEQVWKFALRAGDVLITKDSEIADDIAVPAFVPRDLPGVVCGYHLAVLRPRSERAEGAYVYWALRSQLVRQQFSVAATGVTRFGLRTDAIGSVRVPLPEAAAQRQAVDTLWAAQGRVNMLAAALGSQIDLLTEHRRALITAAVTGQLDVAKAAA